MSAFIVGHDHIDALLTFAKLHRVSYYVPQRLCNVPGGTRVDITAQNATEVGAILLTENERSVRHRYPRSGSDLPGTIGENASGYRFREFGDLYKLPQGQQCAWILSGCRCLDYQSCETDDWQETLAHSIVEAIQAAAIRALPNMADAPWEINRAVQVRS